MQNRDLKKAASLLGKLGGAAKSIKKAKSSRKNGKLGGRPRKVIEKISPCAEYIKSLDNHNGIKLALPQEASPLENIKKESPKLIRRAGIKKETMK